VVPGLVHQEFAYAAELIMTQRGTHVVGPRGGPAAASVRGAGLRNQQGGIGAVEGLLDGGKRAPMAAFDWTDVNAAAGGTAADDDEDDGGGGGGAGWDVGGADDGDDGDTAGGALDVGLDASDIMAGMRGEIARWRLGGTREELFWKTERESYL